MAGSRDAKDKTPEPNWSDFDLITTALGEANAEHMGLDDIMVTVTESKNGLEFSAGIHGMAQLISIWKKHHGYET